MSYCFNLANKTPTLAAMPIHIHGMFIVRPTPHYIITIKTVAEDALDPCNSGIGEGSSHKNYRHHVHAKELPHVSYAGIVPCLAKGRRQGRDEYHKKINDIVKVCSEFYAPHNGGESPLENGRVGDMSDEMYDTWMACMR